MSDAIDIRTDFGELTVSFVGGPHPYVWIGDKDGNFLDTFDLRGSPLTVRRKPSVGVVSV